MERRYYQSGAEIEVREEGRRVLVGYAAVFYRQDEPGTQYALWEGVVERIAPGAFARAIRERQDVRGLFNHDPSLILGRTTAGTLRLSEDARGLRYEIDLAETHLAADLAASVERGDLSGSSFAFTIRSRKIEEDAGTQVRTILDVDLFDVGPVTYPAYEATSAALRGQGEFEELRRDLAERRRLAELEALLDPR
ncbi:MAG: HK97 family phage prohead protease [Planctomycetota bacterium]